jgi:hypothetical protein
MRENRARHNGTRKRAASPELLARLTEIVKNHDVDVQLERRRLELARQCEKDGTTPVEASDENAYAFMREAFLIYVVHFGRKPLDPAAEIDDMLQLLVDLKEQIGTETAQRYNLIKDLLKHKAGWPNVDSPTNVCAFVCEGWSEMKNYQRDDCCALLRASYYAWISRQKRSSNPSKSKKT